jgi:nicotinamidase-related amidase
VLSTVSVETGRSQPTIHQIAEGLTGIESFDRTSINALEDVEFVAAVKATGRKKLIMAALWTEVCLVFPALDALAAGYEVYPVLDAVGGTSLEAHRAGLERISQAGGQPTSWVQLICELQRDWLWVETVPGFADILFPGGEH